MTDSTPFLSICIATRNRGHVLGPTLDALLAQAGGEVEVVVVDGASTDNTADVVRQRAERNAALRYCPQERNSGVDGDFDKAVSLARGEYCWLLSDDDLPLPGALERVLGWCRRGPAAVIVDAEVWSDDFSRLLMAKRLPFTGTRAYPPGDMDRLMADCGVALSFIGALVIRRELWLSRERQAYYGSEFVHIGVLFQAPLEGSVLAVAEPVVRIRYGVGNWTERALQVFMFKWPGIIWSFEHVAPAARRAVTPRQPWRQPALLLVYRAKGWLSWDLYRRTISPLAEPLRHKLPAKLLALLPGMLAWGLVRIAVALHPRGLHGIRWELQCSPYAFKTWSRSLPRPTRRH